jgi:uncharacterized protein
MNLYLDASALMKRYIQEKDSQRVNQWIGAAEFLVTGLITRVEVAAAISSTGRMQFISSAETTQALDQFRSDWDTFLCLPVTESTAARGDALACKHGLRGYDAVHLANALIWQEAIGIPVTLLTFDRQLHEAARNEYLAVLPENE